MNTDRALSLSNTSIEIYLIFPVGSIKANEGEKGVDCWTVFVGRPLEGIPSFISDTISNRLWLDAPRECLWSERGHPFVFWSAMSSLHPHLFYFLLFFYRVIDERPAGVDGFRSHRSQLISPITLVKIHTHHSKKKRIINQLKSEWLVSSQPVL